MPQFFVQTSDIKEKTVYIKNKDDIRHLKSVLRLKIGDGFNLIDENGCFYKTKISDISNNEIQSEILFKEKSTKRLQTDITLAQSIIKASAQDFLVQKATEIGVSTIIPMITDHTVVKLENNKDRLNKKLRWQKIAQEACKQCERATIPIVKDIVTLEEVLKSTDYDLVLACVERNAGQSLKEFCRNNAQAHPKILVIVGPEGGWSNKEFELFDKLNIAQVSLGNLILRAETAVISVISDLVYEYEL